MKTIHRSFGYVKPHAMGSQAAVTAVGDIFETAGVRVSGLKRLSGADVARGGFFDRQHGAAARYATAPDAAALPLGSDGARAAFEAAFGEPLDKVLAAGALLPAERAREKLGLSPDGLLREWAEHGASRIAPGLYVARLEHEGLYVANGFHPAARAPFADPDGPGVMAFELSFEMPWRDFLEVVVGDESPAAALEESVRGFLYDRRDALGLRIDRYDNVIHASSSPLEALLDRMAWRTPAAWRRDPFFKRLGADPAALEALRDDEELLASLRGLGEDEAAAAVAARLR
ncbi:MAG: hypothetical protein IJV65_09600 [Kiritimatiellae bacterium]|nr:hypothetical protein [Kiritimatiellia bacterium]